MLATRSVWWEKHDAHVRLYQAANREHLVAMNKIWSKNHPENKRASAKRYRENDIERARRIGREWAARNKHKINAKKRTFSLSAGTWGQQCANTSSPTDNGEFEIVVQVGGTGYTTGWVNIGDPSQTGGPSNCNGAFWFNGLPCQVVMPITSRFIGGYLLRRDLGADNDNRPMWLAEAA